MDRNDDYYPSFHCPLVLQRREFYRNSGSHYRDVNRKRERFGRKRRRDRDERERETNREKRTTEHGRMRLPDMTFIRH